MRTISVVAFCAVAVLACASRPPSAAIVREGVPILDQSGATRAGDERGCLVTYNRMTGAFLFEPFLKIADKASLTEDGTAEVWGFRVWNLEPPDENGRTSPVNVAASRFVPADGRFHEVPAGGSMRSLRCDMFTNW